jgi:hypothetical protein
MNKECVGFTLKTTDINPSTGDSTIYLNQNFVNGNGRINHNMTELTWFNVNLENIMGEMYNKYDKFNISLNLFGMASQGSAPDADQDSRTLYVKMSGLPWTTYGQMNSDVILNIIELPATGSTTYTKQFTNNQYYTFNKNSNLVNITIKLHAIEPDNFYDILLPPSTIATLPGHMSFTFNIYGVEPYDVDITKNRFIK